MLREELVSHYNNCGDPTYDQLTSGLPYLDAVVQEVLRLHAPLWETTRVVSDVYLLVRTCLMLIFD
jgi:cytochrome P450